MTNKKEDSEYRAILQREFFKKRHGYSVAMQVVDTINTISHIHKSRYGYTVF